MLPSIKEHAKIVFLNLLPVPWLVFLILESWRLFIMINLFAQLYNLCYAADLTSKILCRIVITESADTIISEYKK